MSDGDGGKIIGGMHTRNDGSEPLKVCIKMFENVTAFQMKHEATLYGEHGTDGLVADIAQIKWQTGNVRLTAQLLTQVLTTVVTSIIVAKVLGAI